MGSNIVLMLVCGGFTSALAVNDTLSRVTLLSETSSCMTQIFLSESTLTWLHLVVSGIVHDMSIFGSCLQTALPEHVKHARSPGGGVGEGEGVGEGGYVGVVIEGFIRGYTTSLLTARSTLVR